MNYEKTILIADDDEDLAHALRRRCEALGLRVLCAHDGLDALNLIHDFTPDLICLDVNMPCGNGLGVLEMVMSDEVLRSTPVIVMTGDGTEEIIRRCHHLCAYYVEKCADIWPRIEPLLRELLPGLPNPSDAAISADGKAPPHSTAAADSPSNTPPDSRVREVGAASVSPPGAPRADPVPATSPRPSLPREQLVDAVFTMLGADAGVLGDPDAESDSVDNPPWVLCIDDDAGYSDALKRRLEDHGVAVVRAYAGMEGIRCAFAHPANVILLDYEMPDGQGDYVLRRLKDNPVTRDIPVIMITGVRDRALERRIINMGAAQFLHKPVDFEVLLRELRKYISILPRAASRCSDAKVTSHLAPATPGGEVT